MRDAELHARPSLLGSACLSLFMGGLALTLLIVALIHIWPWLSRAQAVVGNLLR